MNLKNIDPAFKKGQKEEAIKEMVMVQEELSKLQELLYAGHQHSILIVLQGMDASGKDGVIRHSFSGFNPQGVRVVSFKTPTQEESDHDFLWRIHKQVPAKGEIVIFNRSYYEDVLFPKVHELVGNDEIRDRYRYINTFEDMLWRQGTTILKFFLHISKEKQRERLQERIDDPAKNWKISEADLKERLLWDKYIDAYDQVINATNTKYWQIIPSNSQWYRNLLIAKITVKEMTMLNMEYPKPVNFLKGVVVK